MAILRLSQGSAEAQLKGLCQWKDVIPAPPESYKNKSFWSYQLILSEDVNSDKKMTLTYKVSKRPTDRPILADVWTMVKSIAKKWDHKSNADIH
ncbi:hypothetical protein BJ165DRAFT_1531484 [Panaeolus papilionaceus]|nr:hypothetical protein BJ165DRAFT_1531484 [Panaeolus papilionaceus]